MTVHQTLYPDLDLYPGADTFPDEGYLPTQLALEWYDDFAPLVELWGDPEFGMFQYMVAITRMMQPLDDMIKDGPNGEPGWSQILDLQRAKNEWLQWIGQLVGYQVPQLHAEDNQNAWSDRERGRIVTRSAHRRGTIERLRETVQEHLIDPESNPVIIQERFGTSANQPQRITVSVYASHVSTTQALLAAAAQAEKAAGLIMTVNFLTGQDYATLLANQATYAVVLSKFFDYNEVIVDPDKP